ncbi:MAG: VOC family protein [Betaproteobacteria bacterium]|nr:VOC family protein [Betaproteobacteria bacterium]
MLKNFWINMMVKDIHETIACYQRTLGFEHVFSVPKGSEKPLFQYDAGQKLICAGIRCGDIEIILQECESLMEKVPALSHPGLKAGDSSTQVREPSAPQNNCLAHHAMNGEDCARRVFKPDTMTSGTFTLHFETDNINAVAAMVRNTLEIVRDLHDTFYGTREIHVRDPNGYVLCFGQEKQKMSETQLWERVH